MRLPAVVRQSLETWVTAGYPAETCGLLLGLRGGDAVLEVRRCRNLAVGRVGCETAHGGDRFEVCPEDFLATALDADRRGLTITGVWHAHPDRTARPSAADRAGAHPGFAYLIAAVGPPDAGHAPEAAGPHRVELRCWRLAPPGVPDYPGSVHGFVEETLVETEP